MFGVKAMKNVNSGFSLIELMITVAIIGTLALIAVPSYQNYVGKAKMASVITTLQSFSPTIIETYNTTGTWPETVSSGSFTLIPGNNDTLFSSNPNIVTLDYHNCMGTTCSAFVEAVVSNELGGGRIMLAFMPDSNKNLTTICGTWAYVQSTQYLPTTCNNFRILDTVYGGQYPGL
jgi:type IV pilus assembly protein PilA